MYGPDQRKVPRKVSTHLAKFHFFFSCSFALNIVKNRLLNYFSEVIIKNEMMIKHPLGQEVKSIYERMQVLISNYCRCVSVSLDLPLEVDNDCMEDRQSEAELNFIILYDTLGS